MWVTILWVEEDPDGEAADLIALNREGQPHLRIPLEELDDVLQMAVARGAGVPQS